MNRREQWRHAFGQWRRANKSLSDHGAIARSMYWCGILRAISNMRKRRNEPDAE